MNSQAPIKKLITSLGLEEKDVVIEIGPGRGALTKSLALELEKLGGTLVAIEKDPALAMTARAWEINNLIIEEGDALEILPKLSKEFRKFKLAGNIPYYLTGFLLRTIGELENKPALTSLMIQKEVAERLISEPPEQNRLSAAVGFWAKPTIISAVSRKEFSPQPKVESAIIQLETLGDRGIPPEKYYETVRALFAQPRKTILNNLSAKSDLKRKEAVQEIGKKLEKIGLYPEMRPQDLSIEDIISVSREF